MKMEIFLPCPHKLTNEHGHDFIFQEDGASSHTDGYARWWKNKACIKGFDFWTAQSPDLNPIENLWYVLGKLIGQFRPDICVKLCRSMPERCKAVKKALGGHTKY
ncbi:unnamed protein product [Rhizopus stolonifer]